MARWRVTHDDEGVRLDQVVAAHLGVARNQVQLWIRDGLVEVAGKARRASFRVSEGEEISCEARPKETAAGVAPEAGSLAILHEDAEIVVLDKAPGMAVHLGAGRRRGTLVNRLVHAYPELGGVGGPDRPGIVHRLDLDTTGVLVVARTEPAYQALSKAFAERRVEKTYLGIAFGIPRQTSGSIELPIGRHPQRRKAMTVRPGGRPSRTDYRLIAEARGRVHLKALGHPLIGDAVYAGNRWRGAPPPVRGALAAFPRPALHAWRLGFEHPGDGSAVRFEAPLPDDLRALWREVAGTELPSIQ